jgi:hypothetical protein
VNAPRVPALALLALLGVVAAGCGGGSRPAAATTASEPAGRSTTAPAATVAASLVVRAYLLRDGVVAPVGRVVPRTQAVARAALEQLIQGPTAAERDAGLATDVPSGVTVLGLTVAGGTAVVDLSRPFARGGEATISPRLAQVVYTLTQFPTISRVRFELDGDPLTGVTDGHGEILDHPPGRAEYEDLTPPLLVESPLPGETVTSPLRISGTANAFEATFQAEIDDAAGRVLAHRTVMATSGSGQRGTFDESIPYTGDGAGRLVVYEDSAENGSRIHQVEIPLTLGR